jgi:hypothetical protein
VAEKFGLNRESVISEVAERTGIDLHNIGNGESILTAMECLEQLRRDGPPSHASKSP